MINGTKTNVFPIIKNGEMTGLEIIRVEMKIDKLRSDKDRHYFCSLN